MLKRTTLAIAALALALAFTGCKAGGPESPFQVLDEDTSSLRDRFNRDVGKTRVVMLVAPS